MAGDVAVLEGVVGKDRGGVEVKAKKAVADGLLLAFEAKEGHNALKPVAVFFIIPVLKDKPVLAIDSGDRPALKLVVGPLVADVFFKDKIEAVIEHQGVLTGWRVKIGVDQRCATA